jgi:hypothetical protein
MVVKNGQPTTMTNKDGDIIKVMQDSIAYMIEVGWTIKDEDEKDSKPKNKKDK